MTRPSGMTYAGLLDDVVHRYVPEVMADKHFFEKVLLKNIFFGDEMLVNDGYLLADKGLSQAVDENSLVRALVSAGFIKILTKVHDFDEENFAALPEKMAREGVNTSRALVASTDWPTHKKSLRRWARGIKDKGSNVPFPPYQMHEGFRRLVEPLYESNPEELGLTQVSKYQWDNVIYAIMNRDEYEMAPRSAFEEVLKEKVRLDELRQLAKQQIMSLACQAYHLNFSLCLQDHLCQPFVTETTIGTAFEGYFAEPDFSEMDQSLLDDLPVIAIPAELPLDRPELFVGLVDPGTKIYEQKQAFFSQIQALVSCQNSSSDHIREKEISEAIWEYRSHLVEHFVEKGMRFNDITSPLEDLALSSVGYCVSKVSDAFGVFQTFGPTLKKIPGVKSIAGQLTKRSDAIKKFFILESTMPSYAEGIASIKGQDIAAKYTALAVDSVAAQNHVRDLPRFGA